MAEKRLRIGRVTNWTELEAVLRDIEIAFGQIEDLAAVLTADPPATPSALVQLADGTFEVWDIVSTGGCTITKNAGLKQIQISVP